MSQRVSAKSAISKHKPCSSPEGHRWRMTMVLDYGLQAEIEDDHVATYNCVNCKQTITVGKVR